jgi:rod shape-determining protein MreD
MLIKNKTAFLLALLFTLLGPIFFPKWHLFYFAPYIVISYYQCSRIAALWRSYMCGLILDLLSSAPFFGFSSLNYCLVSLALYSQKRNFFEDKLSTLPLMTFLFSLLSTLITLILSLFFGHHLRLTWQWPATDLLFMPLADALYASLLFSLPFHLLHYLRHLRLRRSL